MLQFQLTKERKIILLIGGILLLWGAGYRLMPLFQLLGSNSGEVDLKREQIGNYQKRIQNKNQLLQRQLAFTRDAAQLKRGLLKGQTPALSAVTMQNRLNEIAESISAEIKTTRVLKPTSHENSDFMTVPLMLSLELNIRQLKRFLYKIETSDILLKVTDLRLRKVGGDLPVALQATVTIAGFMSKPISTGS